MIPTRVVAIVQGFLDYTDKELPAESPPQFGLHPNAEIGYLTNSCESLFKAILNIAGQREGCAVRSCSFVDKGSFAFLKGSFLSTTCRSSLF